MLALLRIESTDPTQLAPLLTFEGDHGLEQQISHGDESPIDERVARQWLRDGVSFVVQSLAGHAPAHYEDDPEGLREIVFAGLERFAHLLSDGGQSATVSLIFDRVGLRAFELARHLYHQPTVGPRFKAMIHEQLTEPYADKLIANPPGPDEPPPWARP